MGNISQKLTYLNGTKTKIREGLNSLGADLDTQDTFRSYADAIEGIYEDYPKITGEGTYLSLDNTKQAPMKIVYKGNASQDGTPTPSSPIPVNVVSGDNTIDICGENLLKYPYRDTTKTISGITFTDLGDGTIKANGTATANCYFYITTRNDDYYKNMKGQTLRLVGCPSGGSNSTYRLIFCNDNWIGGIDTGSGINFVAQDTYYNQALIQIYNGTTVNDLIFKPMLTKIKTTSYNDFEPYIGKSYPINLGSLELCKIGTYQDYIYKDSGSWYLHKEIGKVVLNGNERINSNSDYINYGRFDIMNYTNGIKGSASLPGAMSDYFVGGFNINNGSVFLSGLDSHINVINTSYSRNLAGFKTWLSTHNTTVYYVLATPTNTEITDTTLIEQLEESKLSYVSQTNISQENNDLPFILDVKALRGE